MATIYRHPGIDYETVTLPDQTGRPAHIVQNGKAIPELIASQYKSAPERPVRSWNCDR